MSYVFLNISGEAIYVAVVGESSSANHDFASEVMKLVPGAVNYTVTESWDIQDRELDLLDLLSTTSAEG